MYSLYCHQNNVLMATGENSRTKEEVKEALLSYLSADHDEDDIKRLSNEEPDVLAGMYEFEIVDPATFNN
jgi:hypothetical protein